MKQFTSILFLLLFLSVTFQDTTYYLLFKLNQVNITEAFCVNKEKVEMKCHGKCYLKKQVKKNNENKKEEKASRERLEIPFFIEESIIEPTTPLILDKKLAFNFNLPHFVSYENLLDPPELIS